MTMGDAGKILHTLDAIKHAIDCQDSTHKQTEKLMNQLFDDVCNSEPKYFSECILADIFKTVAAYLEMFMRDVHTHSLLISGLRLLNTILDSICVYEYLLPGIFEFHDIESLLIKIRFMQVGNMIKHFPKNEASKFVACIAEISFHLIVKLPDFCYWRRLKNYINFEIFDERHEMSSQIAAKILNLLKHQHLSTNSHWLLKQWDIVLLKIFNSPFKVKSQIAFLFNPQ